MSMPFNKDVKPEEVFIRNLPGFGDIKFYDVKIPAFIDHSLEVRTVQTDRFKLSDLEKLLRQNVVYVHECYRDWQDEQNNTYTLRYYICSEWKLAPIITHIDIEQVKIISGTLRPYFPISMHLSPTELIDLTAAWGRDETVRQLGEYILTALETREYDGKPDLPK